jgi:hypothetical protein
MTKADHAVERGAERLQKLSEKAAARGDGVGEWLAEELANDAAFMRKLKPSLIRARARGQAPTNQAPSAPSKPQLGPPAKKRKKKTKKRSGGKGPAPVVVVGAALVAGVLLAKVLDWRGHAHPRD